MAGITYIKGDATCPQAKGVKLIPHVCNDMGRWGKGFVLALSRRWRQPEEQYRAWYAGRTGEGFGLGAVQFIQVESYIWVANMIAQRGTKTGSSGPPIRYEALAEMLAEGGREGGGTPGVRPYATHRLRPGRWRLVAHRAAHRGVAGAARPAGIGIRLRVSGPRGAESIAHADRARGGGLRR